MFVPKVEKFEIDENKIFHFTNVKLGENSLTDEARFDFLSFINLPEGRENIFFEVDENMGDEEYSIKIDEKIVITSKNNMGAFYALQTIKQLYFTYKSEIPQCSIFDKPKHPYRGFMLDVGRYFYSVLDVKKVIDRMVLHKLNYFHFHLTEDQGWRIEIKRYPELTEIGSKRTHTNFNHTPHSGFYTQEEIKEIVDYAHSKYIKVIPEFDVPGHSMAAIATYNHLKCIPGESEVATHWGIKHDVLCAGKESTYEFVFNVLDEICELFTDGIIHIGGDEIPKLRWQICPECQKKMKEIGAKDEDELQIYFMNRVNRYLNEKGIKTFMWSYDIKNTNGLDENIAFSLCQNNEVSEKRNFVDTSMKACYMDFPYAYISLKRLEKYNISNKKNCLGIEAELWTEYVPNMKKADLMAYPRVGALSNIGWHGDAKNFSATLKDYEKYLNQNGIIPSTRRKINPIGLRMLWQTIEFEKRQFALEGITNIIRDKRAKKTAKEMK